MTQNKSMTDNDHELPLSLGKRFQLAREQQGLTVEQVAEQLKVLPRMVQDIEIENYQALPEPVFIKGYIRLYAQLLSLPTEEISLLFDRSYQAKPPVHQKTEPQVLQVLESYRPTVSSYRRSSSSWLPVVLKVLLVVLIVVAIGAGLWQSTLFRQQTSMPMESKIDDHTISLPNVSTAKQSVDTLDLRFSAATKVRIADANGQELANATKQSGENLTVQGQSPFAIELNPATAVEFRFNNNVIDLKPYTVNGMVNFRLSR